jgi:hypothetical protein
VSIKDSLKNSHLGASLEHPPFGPLSLRERAGVRVLSLRFVTDQ